MDSNDPPTDISLSASSIPENQGIGTLVGNLSVTDEDASDSFTYVVGGTDATDFQVDGNALLSSSVFDFDVQNIYGVTITATDSGGEEVTKEFSITIEDALGLDQNGLIKIYPNPTDGKFQVLVDSSIKEVSWLLTDTSGKIVESQSSHILKNNTILFDLLSLGSGVYFLSIENESLKLLKKIIVE